jgi:hypothetical protein
MNRIARAIIGRLDLILAKLNHLIEALDLILPASAQLNAEAVARARANLEHARRSGDRPKFRVLTNPTEAQPEGPPDQKPLR